MDELSREIEAATEETAAAPPQQAPDPREAGVKGFISKLVKAKKDSGFYPKGNPAVRDAMEQCEECQSEALGSEGALTLLVSGDQFYLDDRALFPSGTPESRFAAELFALGLRHIAFTGEAQAPDFEQLMNLLVESGDEPSLLNAALRGSSEQTIRGIELDQIADLEVVDESSLIEEIDLALERLEDEEESSVDIGKIVEDIYVRILPGTLEPRQITKLMENPVRIREAFSRLARAREGTVAATVATDVAGRVLGEITSTIADAPLKEQEPLLRATAELLLETEEPLRTKLLLEKILPRVTSDSHEAALLRSLTDEELVELLTTRVPLHEGVLGVISTSFCNLGLSLPRRQSILNLIREGSIQGGPEGRWYAELFDGLSAVAGVDISVDGATTTAGADIPEMIPSRESLQLNDDEEDWIDDTVRHSGSEPDIENIPALIDLLHLEKDVSRYRRLLGTLETLRKEALNRASLDAAVEVVQGYAFLRRKRDLSADKWEILEKAWERAAGAETITLLAHLSLNYQKGSPEYSLILEYLRTVLDRAYRTLLERLGEEDAKSARLAIRGLLIALGGVDVDALRSRVLHKQWFVARNVVSILGEIGGERAVEALADALRHDEPRVRHETLNALGKIGGESSAQVIAGALEDRDTDVALCAARWVTTLGDVAPLGRLFTIVQSGRFRRADPDTVLLAVQAVGRRDDPKAVSFLRKIARKRIGSLFGTRKRIAICAAKALRANAANTRGALSDRNCS